MTDQQDLYEVNGTLRTIEQVLVYGHKVNKTERDSTYYIYLNEYPAAFQVSYHSYNRTKFYRNSMRNDKIQLHIPAQDIDELTNPNAKIRSFSLKVNQNAYLTSKQGVRGFGKGYFELVMIFLPALINFFLIRRALVK